MIVNFETSQSHKREGCCLCIVQVACFKNQRLQLNLEHDPLVDAFSYSDVLTSRMLAKAWGLCPLRSALMNSNLDWALSMGVSASGCKLRAGRSGLRAQHGHAKRPT